MNQKLKAELELKIYVCQCLIDGKKFHIDDSQRQKLPVECMTKTEAKKKGFVLKRGAKPVGEWGFQIVTGGRGYGVLYLSSSFKVEK
ncbi:hypothetical protein [Pseudoalteromonas citrea]|nr:hypothetical protein [Pseudoalteromonas citrea]